MEISKLHIGPADYDFFTSLDDKQKIVFISDVSEDRKIKSPYLRELGKQQSIKQNLEKERELIEQRLNDLFQDTLYDEFTTKNGKLTVVILNRYVHLNSNSLSLIKSFIFKMFDDGHILIRIKNAQKIPGIDKFKYYRCYEIVGSGEPFCPN
tara:strand:+ start:2144 stop:2599 length:456 start_codon:yes stop_codon:yes gene_type:complete